MDTTRITTIPNSAVVEDHLIIHTTASPSSALADAPLPITETMLRCIAVAVDTSFLQHNRTNGSIVSLIYGDMVGTKLFSVSIYPSRFNTLWERPSWEQLFEFSKANLDLLLRPDHALGTWFDDFECVHSLGVVLLARDQEFAAEIGRHFAQSAIFDLQGRREISIRQSAQAPVGQRPGDDDA